MRTKLQKLHLLLVVVLIALLYSFLGRSGEPKMVEPRTQMTKASDSKSVDGIYGHSDGYSGENITLENGMYERTWFACTGNGVISEGTYKIEGTTLLLVDPSRKFRTRYDIAQDRLTTQENGYIVTFIKHVDASGNEIPGANVYRNSILDLLQDSPERISRGKRLFEANCKECHNSRIPELDLSKKSGYKYSAEFDEINRVILEGLEGTSMMPYDGILTEVEIFEITCYLKSIQE